MNRREFCFSLGTAVVGGIAVGSAKREARAVSAADERVLPASFRAKKIFPEQWRDVLGFDTASEQTRRMQHSLRGFVAHDTALVVASLSGWSPVFLELLQAESLRTGLEFYLPAGFPGEATYRSRATDIICPLQVTRQGVESAKSWDVPCDGFLFSLSGMPGECSAKPRGLFLCDASRGTWQTFLCQTPLGRDSVSPGSRHLANLQTARWLDFAKKRMHGL